MKIIVEQSSILKTLAHIQSIVERKNTIPILANVLLKAENQKLLFTATDMDIEIIDSIDADIEAEGSTTVPAHTLYDIVRKLDDGCQITLEQTDEVTMSITAGNSKFVLGCLSSEDFPIMSSEDTKHNFTLKNEDFKNVIDKTKFAISTEETRYYLNGIFFHEKNNKLIAVATDGHRLAKVMLNDSPDGIKGMPGIIIPRKAIFEIRKLADDSEENIEIHLSSNKIIFNVGSIKFTSKLIDGTFPDYERVIPSNNDKELTLDPKSFANIVDRVSTVSIDKTSTVSLSLAEDLLKVSVNAPNCGSADDELPVMYKRDEMKIGFNARYLIELSNHIENQQCTFILADSSSPAVVTDSSDELDVLYILMPTRI